MKPHVALTKLIAAGFAMLATGCATNSVFANDGATQALSYNANILMDPCTDEKPRGAVVWNKEYPDGLMTPKDAQTWVKENAEAPFPLMMEAGFAGCGGTLASLKSLPEHAFASAGLSIRAFGEEEALRGVQLSELASELPTARTRSQTGAAGIEIVILAACARSQTGQFGVIMTSRDGVLRVPVPFAPACEVADAGPDRQTALAKEMTAALERAQGSGFSFPTR